MRKKVLARMRLWIVLTLVGLGSLGGMAVAAGPTINVWIFKSTLPEMDKYLVETFEAWGDETGIDVEVTGVPNLDMLQKLLPTIEAGTPPDVVTMFGLDTLRFTDQLLDVTDLYDEIGESWQGWISLADSLLVEDRSYGIPFMVEMELVYCRSDRLKEAGLAYPTTWEEFREAALKTNDPKRGIYGFGQPLGGRTTDAEKAFRMILWGFGGSIADEDGKTVVFDSPETVEATRFYTDMYLVDKSIPPGATAWGGSDNNIMYETGRSNFVINTGSIWASIQKKDPILVQNTMLLPTPSGPYGSRTFAQLDSFVIFKATQNPELAKDMLRYMYDADRYNGFIRTTGGAYPPPLQNALHQSMWRGYPGRVFVENALTGGYPGYPGPSTVAAGRVISDLIISDMLGKIAVEGISVEDAVKWADSRMEEVYAEYYE